MKLTKKKTRKPVALFIGFFLLFIIVIAAALSIVLFLDALAAGVLLALTAGTILSAWATTMCITGGEY